MAQKFIEYSPPPVRTPLLSGAGLLEVDWEKWFHRLQWFITKRASCSVRRTSAQTITTATETDVLWDSQDHDNANMHDTSTNSDRITIPSDGIYLAGASVSWSASGTTGYRRVRITLNDASPVAASAVLDENLLNASAGPTGFIRHGVKMLEKFSAGDIIRVSVTHTQGTDTDIQADSASANGFWCFKVSDPPAVAG